MGRLYRSSAHGLPKYGTLNTPRGLMQQTFALDYAILECKNPMTALPRLFLTARLAHLPRFDLTWLRQIDVETI